MCDNTQHCGEGGYLQLISPILSRMRRLAILLDDDNSERGFQADIVRNECRLSRMTHSLGKEDNSSFF
jgi:hypothetical protein